jgi:hypothetical protein
MVGLRIVRLLASDGNGSELPAPLVATSAKVPTAFAFTVTFSVAAVPCGFIDAELTTMPGGTRVGRKEKVELVRFKPVIWTLEVVAFDSVNRGLIERITGVARTVKGVVDVAVLPPTVTEIKPVVAPPGTVTNKLVVVAETTVAVTPSNLTSLAEAVALKPWP